MALLSKEEFKVYQEIINLSQNKINLVITSYLNQYYKNVISTKDYIYAIGEIPIALIAHMDTVFEESLEERTITYGGKTYVKPEPDRELYYDQWKEVIACPIGAGHDDRAGLYAIIRLLEKGYRPSIILTTDEEKGGIGASKFVAAIPQPLSDIRYLIQLDRRGQDDCVFYDLDDKQFEVYIESFGFKTNYGSFTDISVICPAWNVAGVNLSIGYMNEHTEQEVLHVDWWISTINRVCNMLSAKEIPSWEYKEKKSIYNYNYGYGNFFDDDSYVIKCDNCNEEYDIFETKPLIVCGGKTKHFCYNCYDKMHKCEKCGNHFFRKKPEWKYCKSCSKEMRKGWKFKKKK